MVIAKFLLKNKLGSLWFFEKTFLLADTSMEVILGIPFLILSNADVNFPSRELQWQPYNTSNALPTTQRLELINKKIFARTALDENAETFGVHVVAPKATGITIHPFQAAQITLLLANEASTKVPSKYSDYSDVFLPDLAIELPEYTDINDHTIKLKEDK